MTEENTNTQNQQQEAKPSFAQIPLAVLKAPVSERAKVVYGLAVAYGKGGNKAIWLRHLTLSEDLDCSIASIQRALLELIKAGLLKKKERKFQGRYPYYEFQKNWDASPRSSLHAQNDSDRPPQSSVTDNTLHPRPCLVDRGSRKKSRKKQQQPVELPTGPIAEQMIRVGLAPDVVAELLFKFGEEACELQLKNLDSQKNKPDNKAGWLKRAIERNYNFQVDGKSQAEIKAEGEKEKRRAESLKAAKEAYADGKWEAVFELLKEFNDNESALLRSNTKSRLKEQREKERLAKVEAALSEQEREEFRRDAESWASRKFSDVSSPFFEAGRLCRYNDLIQEAAGKLEVAHA